MLKKVSANVGSQSRAGLNAKPFFVSKLLTTTKITRPTIIDFNPVVKLLKFNKMKIKLKVAIASDTKLNSDAAIIGFVAKYLLHFDLGCLKKNLHVVVTMVGPTPKIIMISISKINQSRFISSSANFNYI